MPASVRGQRRDNKIAVKINSRLAFVWSSVDVSSIAGVSSADVEALGHMPIAAAIANTNLVKVSGANAPKPARVGKKLPNSPIGQRASVSTYCAFDKMLTAIAAGFKLLKESKSAPRIGQFGDGEGLPVTRTMYGVVTLSNGLKYASPMDPRVADVDLRASLGIEKASEISVNDKLLLVRGSRSRPGKAQGETGVGISATLPYSTAKYDGLTGSWQPISKEYVEYPSAAPAAPAGN